MPSRACALNPLASAPVSWAPRLALGGHAVSYAAFTRPLIGAERVISCDAPVSRSSVMEEHFPEGEYLDPTAPCRSSSPLVPMPLRGVSHGGRRSQRASWAAVTLREEASIA